MLGLVFAVLASVSSYGSDLSVNSGFVSKYVGKQSGTVFTDGPAVQSGINFTTEKKLPSPIEDGSVYFGLWNSTGLNTDAGNETDICYGWAGKINGFSTDVGISYYDFSNTFRKWSDSIFAPHWEIGGNVCYVRVELALPTGGSSYDCGTYVTVGHRESWDLGGGASLNCDVGLTKDDGTYNGTPNWILGGSSDLSLQRGLWTVKVLSLQFTAPLQDDASRGEQLVWGADISRKF